MEDNTVLVVDDSQLNRKLIRTILGMKKIGVIEAGDAENGLELARAKRPDLILMDLKMPGMNGLQATEVLKADSETADIPVIILSAGSVPEDDQQMRESGVAALILKPFSANELIETVCSFLT
jgi:CheY-like chemotaxis protein